MRSENLKVQEEDFKMEQLKANILNMISGEYTSYYKLSSEALQGLRSTDDLTAEGKIAYSMFQAINRYASSRSDIERALHSLINTCQSEMKRLHSGWALDLGWVNSSRFEEYVQESKKLWHEIQTLAYIVGLNADQVNQLADKINGVIEYKK
jgi:uncharacterized protein YukE